MKKLLYIFVIGLVAACSSPKYTASFINYNKYDNSNNVRVAKQVKATPIEANALEASSSNAPAMIATTSEPAMVSKTYLQMNKQQRKEVRQQIKSELKSLVKANKSMGVYSTQATQGMDKDLKLAAVFGAVGIVGLIIGGDVFYIIGGLAMIIGVVFFVKWLVRQ